MAPKRKSARTAPKTNPASSSSAVIKKKTSPKKPPPPARPVPGKSKGGPSASTSGKKKKVRKTKAAKKKGKSSSKTPAPLKASPRTSPKPTLDVLPTAGALAITEPAPALIPVATTSYIPRDPAGPIPEIDVVISFDTTGSMGPCINEVRKHVTALVNQLFTELATLRIGIVAHGDYDHIGSTYLMEHVDLTDHQSNLIKFMNATGNSGPGRSYPEAYEYMLREVQKFSWRPTALRAMIVIGDSTPHEANDNPHNIEWRTECDQLKNMNVSIYAVQALDSGSARIRSFYDTMAAKTNGYHLYLDQFSYVRDMILAVCIRQCGEEPLTLYEQRLVARPGGLTLSMRRMFDTMLGRKTAVAAGSDVNYGPSTSYTDLRPCPPSKYQVLEVEDAVPIKVFVQNEGLTFKTGKGFYEFMKPEQISAKKEIVLMKKSTGELFEGNAARAIAGITSANETKKVAPGTGALGDYRVFVQSTSYNRGLVPGTGFLYEAEDYGRT